MRILLALVAVAAISIPFVACGDSGSGGGGAPADPNSAVGTWTADMTPFVDMMKPMFESMLKMAEGLPSTGAGADEAKKKVEEARQKIAELEKAEMTMTLKNGGSASFRAVMPGEATDEGTGTWSQAGNQVTIQMTTSNGKPATGKKAEAKTLTLSDGVLSMSEGPMTLTFKRK